MAERADGILPDLEVRNLVKRFGSVAAVDHVSLAVEPGEVLALLGPSGSGKSTLLAMTGGQLHPDSGEILLAGQSVARLPPNRIDAATVFQDYALFPHLTVAENIAFGLRMRRRPASEIAERTREVLRMVELEGFGDRYPAQLSGGQKQRAATARALVVEPRVLLMDEPLSALDLQIRLRLQRELRDLLRRVGVTTIIVTHDQQEAFVLADRIAVLRDGRLEQVGRPSDLYHAPASRFVATFLGDGSLLTGRVLASAGGALSVECAGKALEIPGRGTPGERITVLIRPEDVFLGEDAADPRAIWTDVPVTRVFNTGETTRYALGLGDADLAALELGRPRFAEGDRISVQLRRKNIVTIRGGE
jgi:ABC-type Fe3+/spermidine/putrescine transport system ATPase subunit